MLTPTYIYATPVPRQVTTIYGRHIDLDPHYADPSYGLKWDQHFAAARFEDAERYVTDIFEKVKAVYKPQHPEIGAGDNYLKESGDWSEDGNGHWYRLTHEVWANGHGTSTTLAEYHIHTSRIIESIKYIDK